MDALAIDVGATAVKSAIVHKTESQITISQHLTPVSVKTPHIDEIERSVRLTIERGMKHQPHVHYVGLATTGLVDAHSRVSGHFIQSYQQFSWRDALKSSFPRLSKVIVVNDGNAAALGEYLVRAEQDAHDLIHFVVGTGIGGGIVINGRLHTGARGMAAELGQTIVSTHQPFPTAGMGSDGGVELYASRTAMIRYVKDKLENGRISQLNRSHESIDIPLISRLAAEDELAYEAFIIAGKWLGIAIATVINLLNPHLVTIGGGVVAAAPKDEKDQNAYVAAARRQARLLACSSIIQSTVIRQATLGNNAALLGAGFLALQSEGFP